MRAPHVLTFPDSRCLRDQDRRFGRFAQGQVALRARFAGLPARLSVNR